MTHMSNSLSCDYQHLILKGDGAPALEKPSLFHFAEFFSHINEFIQITDRFLGLILPDRQICFAKLLSKESICHKFSPKVTFVEF